MIEDEINSGKQIPILNHFQLLGRINCSKNILEDFAIKNSNVKKIKFLSHKFNLSYKAAHSFLRLSEYSKKSRDLLDIFFYIDPGGNFHFDFYEMLGCKALTIKKTRCKNIYDGHSFYNNRSTKKFVLYNFYCPTHDDKSYENEKNNFPNRSLDFNSFISCYKSGKKILKLKNVPGYTIFKLLKEIR